MDESLIELFKLLESQSLEDKREIIRTKIYKEIDEFRKNDYEFLKILEREERNLFNNLIFIHKKFSSKLNNLIKNYDCLVGLKFATDRYKKDLENTV